MDDRTFDRIAAAGGFAVAGLSMVVLFVATAVGIGPLVLLSGGLASVVLGPIWWVAVARLLWRGAPQTAGA